MPIPTTEQDLVKGVDFTAINPQTASEHNQLVDLATPYTDGANNEEGIGYILTTTDTALDTPSVPDPTQAISYQKWKRYIWSRRPFGAPSPLVSKIYQWVDAATADATYLNWVLVDTASQTTIGGGFDTLLQAAIDTINTDSANALAAANSASAAVTALATDVGTVVGTDLQTQVTANTNSIATNVTSITAINTAIGGSAGLAGTGGINGQITALQAAVQAGTTEKWPVTQIIASTTPFAQPRTNSDASAVEWYDPSNATSSIIKATATGTVTFPVNATTAITLVGNTTVPPGTYVIHAFLGGIAYQTGTSGSEFRANINIAVGAQNFSGITAGLTAVGGAQDKCAITLPLLDYVTVAVLTGNVVLSASITTASAISVSCAGLYLTILLKRV